LAEDGGVSLTQIFTRIGCGIVAVFWKGSPRRRSGRSGPSRAVQRST